MIFSLIDKPFVALLHAPSACPGPTFHHDMGPTSWHAGERLNEATAAARTFLAGSTRSVSPKGEGRTVLSKNFLDGRFASPLTPGTGWDRSEIGPIFAEGALLATRAAIQRFLVQNQKHPLLGQVRPKMERYGTFSKIDL